VSHRRLGMLGSAFNPPHIGHLVLAQEAAAQLDLERILLIPTGRPPHKEIADDPGRLARLEMTELVAAGNDLLEVDPFEIDSADANDEPSYTVTTLEELHRRRKSDAIFLLMGADMAARFDSWHRPDRILELARLAVAARSGTLRDETEAALERLAPGDRVEVIRMPEIDISSTRIRRRVAEGRPIRYLVTNAVLEFIEAQGLYSR
jgi:nicotinate-nucleotide adenylyltransferase